jgi:2,3-bisphosphoglycerate-dependent phosphoglycerate mutase
VPLSEEGQAQALALAGALAGANFDRAVSSDLSRAYDTARAICGEQRVERDPRWREFAFGEWEGLTWEEIVARRPEYGAHASTAAKQYAPPGGETFQAVCARVADALADLRAGGHARVLVVTHAGPLHAMLHTLFGEREAEFQEALGVRFTPASITRVRFDSGQAELVQLNDAAHLY